MSKRLVIQAILARLQAELENYMRSALAAQAEATDEQSKSENKYDTRSLEASYLAHGQSSQALEVSQAMQQYQQLSEREFSAHEAIGLGALVSVEQAGEQRCYFLGPSAGGTEVLVEGQSIVVITPRSPLGQLLSGRRAPEVLRLPSGKAGTLRILAVS